MTTLVLFEEGTYSATELRDRIGASLAVGQPQGVPDQQTIDNAWKALRNFNVARARLVQPGGATGGDDEPDDGETEAETEDGCVQLLRPVGGDRWKVTGLVGSGTLLDGRLAFEVLPKIYSDMGGAEAEKTKAARAGLLRMWRVAEGVSLNEHHEAGGVEQEQDVALHEWLAKRFLDNVEALMQRGVRMQYVERDDNLTVLRGRLLPPENLRVNAFASHRFYCRFEELSLDRPENRLIRAALQRVERGTREAATRRRASSLGDRLHEVPPSRLSGRDFAAWKDDRLMIHYRALRISCSWILHERMPAPVGGEQQMFGCFVRMHKLFERYVQKWLEMTLRGDGGGLRVEAQADKVFCRGLDSPWHQDRMRPDLLIYSGSAPQPIRILDTKWKKVGPRDRIARADLFQMVAYAKFWFSDNQKPNESMLGLIYPTLGEPGETTKLRFEAPMEGVALETIRFRLPTFPEDGPHVIEGLADGILNRLRGLPLNLEGATAG
jgi:5-methylcytosine-specific restriction enzyme subunit McrC